MTQSNRTQNKKPADLKQKLVCCLDCAHSELMRYKAKNPIVADCHKKPQPHNDRFPFQREVASTMRLCPMYLHTDKEKPIKRMQQ